MAEVHDELEYEGGGLAQETNWWGAFVIGLAGTILVTGIAPVMVTALGAASIPVIIFITITGYLLCLLLAELSAMMPERTGGSPSYAYPAYRERWPRLAKHINGFTAWAYWLGWFPVAPLNMILASFYLADRFHQIDGTGFFSSLSGHGWLTVYIAYSFLLTWNVIAMEAAACYIGECKNPDRDAKIAMNLEGAYGLFIYTLIPIAFIIVLGAKALSNSALVDPKTIFVTFAGKVFSTGGNVLNWLVALMLIVALALSALNAIMGCARSLHQMSVDGQFPRFFQHLNKHGVPDRAMFFNVLCSLVVVLAGGAVEIYSFSNVGYTFSFIPVLVGYYLLRKYKPNARRPVRLPEFFKYVALGMAVLYFVIWLYGGIYYSKIGNTLVYYLAGWGVLAAYLPLYWYRVRVEDRREVPETSAGPTS